MDVDGSAERRPSHRCVGVGCWWLARTSRERGRMRRAAREIDKERCYEERIYSGVLGRVEEGQRDASSR